MFNKLIQFFNNKNINNCDVLESESSDNSDNSEKNNDKCGVLASDASGNSKTKTPKSLNDPLLCELTESERELFIVKYFYSYIKKHKDNLSQWVLNNNNNKILHHESNIEFIADQEYTMSDTPTTWRIKYYVVGGTSVTFTLNIDDYDKNDKITLYIKAAIKELMDLKYTLFKKKQIRNMSLTILKMSGKKPVIFEDSISHCYNRNEINKWSRENNYEHLCYFPSNYDLCIFSDEVAAEFKLKFQP